MAGRADLQGEGRQNEGKGEPPPSPRAHTPSLSPLEGKQAPHSQGWAVKCLSLLAIQHLLPGAQPPRPLHLERKTLATNKRGDYLKRIACRFSFFSLLFFFFSLIVGGVGWRQGAHRGSAWCVLQSRSHTGALGDSGGQGARGAPAPGSDRGGDAGPSSAGYFWCSRRLDLGE